MELGEVTWTRISMTWSRWRSNLLDLEKDVIVFGEARRWRAFLVYSALRMSRNLYQSCEDRADDMHLRRAVVYCRNKLGYSDWKELPKVHDSTGPHKKP